MPRELLLFLAIWLAAAAFVDPVGDFPINDDWSFATAARRFHDTGVFRPTGSTSMSLLTNTLWGSLFLIPNGFSFTALRISTLSLSLVGAVAVWLAFSLISSNRVGAFVAALTFAFCPLYYSLSHTFMTDVPFVSLLAISSYFIILTLDRFSWRSYLAAAGLSLAAMLSRQLALAIPIGFAGALVMRYGWSWRNITVALAPIVTCVGAYLLLRQYLTLTNQMPVAFDNLSNGFVQRVFSVTAIPLIVNNLYIALLYLGLFLSPLLLPSLGFRNWRPRDVGTVAAATVLLFAVGGIRTGLLGKPMLMPLSGNVLESTGLGPQLLVGFQSDSSVQQMSSATRFLITAVSWAGAIGLLQLLTEAIWDLFCESKAGHLSFRSAVVFFSLLSTTAALFPMLVAGFYDRYLLTALPPLFVLLAATRPMGLDQRGAQILALMLAGVMAALTITATRDQMNIYRARWAGIAFLKQDVGAADEEIDGGFEFNGFFCYDPAFKPRKGKSTWWVTDDRYRVAVGDAEGYSTIWSKAVPRLLPLGPPQILVLKRDEP